MKSMRRCAVGVRSAGLPRPRRRFLVLALLSALLVGCGHTYVAKVGLMSFGNLEGKIIPDRVDGPVLTGKHSSRIGATSYYLSTAVRNALQQTEYDTLVDVEIANKTGLFVWSNYILVRGTALNSNALPHSGGAK